MTTITPKKVADGLKFIGKCALATVAVGAVFETTTLGAKMMIDDGIYTYKMVDAKVNPIIMKKPGLFRKPQPYNTRTKKFVNQKKNKKSK